jgi:hypothetical protein
MRQCLDCDLCISATACRLQEVVDKRVDHIGHAALGFVTAASHDHEFGSSELCKSLAARRRCDRVLVAMDD